jgi:hypothetical protein
VLNGISHNIIYLDFHDFGPGFYYQPGKLAARDDMITAGVEEAVDIPRTNRAVVTSTIASPGSRRVERGTWITSTRPLSVNATVCIGVYRWSLI